MRPAPVRTRAADRARVLAAYGNSRERFGGHPFAVFGLYSESKTVDRPQWLVVVCDGDQPAVATVPPMGYPGTPPSPSPSARQLGIAMITYGATSGRRGGEATSGVNLPAFANAEYVHVPWTVVGKPTPRSRLVRISYPAAEPCATFDHLEVELAPAHVDVRVWLRVLPGGPASCPGHRQHQALVGLSVVGRSEALGRRALRDAGSAPPDELY